ncbi:SAM-dependent methyltransferase [Actinoalloteichus hymeniacidonis]|uniref:Methyltransferase, cyclopropane fatty acid synthase n=1 Tax=Actinoalloteichus hymeniacidonis TaxID=340345 RepID=A0AAC9HSY1_9PSEU|nr:cyclopropane-fatty-acyl-phospholipid synthase family protein [Actinoalloteichus hymeniacidonis]AOS64356.1 methyltransferase, cyclopropane fatty acid synthase [Actinoalloteichus hymeniacidonis]MBB5907576.1 cyclopropane-fatty-acyl-phospholipid synthase [Actinoalloteichus hymeniacidonis]
MRSSPQDIDQRVASPTPSLLIPRPEQGEWPGLADPPDSPLRAKVAEVLFRSAVRSLPLRVEFPDGTVLGAGDVTDPLMRLVRPRAFFHRLGADAKIGFGEAYLVGDWTSKRPADLLTVFAQRLTRLIPRRLQHLRRFVERAHPIEERNTLRGARQNIHRHYDLSNELFEIFLDETTTYSSALFDDSAADPTAPSAAADPMSGLRAAQLRKIDAILDRAGVGPDTTLLEIGTGWGALAVRAAQRGAEVTSLTLSAEQQRAAQTRIAGAGVADRVRVLLQDYREADGGFDAVVSVEMIEAVGERYWPDYFRAVDRLLRPGGRFGLQSILMPHDRMLAARNSYGWVHKYVFPGGLIPSMQAIEENLRSHTSLRIREALFFGADYAETLHRWRERFLARWSEVAELGFDPTFRRMWEFYLAYSEAGFRSGHLDVAQFTIVKPE